jgi:hypothetical protein
MVTVFMILLILSGVTAFPLEWEMKVLTSGAEYFPDYLNAWLDKVYTGIRETNRNYPFMAYGTDWLAFAHITIAVFFIGVLKDPVRNIFIIQAGMINSILVFPLAFIAGPIREIPTAWLFIDCSFGVFSFLLLWLCYKKIKKLEKMEKKSFLFQ